MLHRFGPPLQTARAAPLDAARVGSGEISSIWHVDLSAYASWSTHIFFLSCPQLNCYRLLTLSCHPTPPPFVVLLAQKDGNKDLSKTLYNMLLVGNGAPSLSAANAAIKGCPQIESAMVRPFYRLFVVLLEGGLRCRAVVVRYADALEKWMLSFALPV